MESGGGGISAAATSPPPFLSKTYDMVDDPATDTVVSWSKSNNSFVVWNVLEFSRDLLPKYFKHNNFSSFVRQLNTYGFRKVDPGRWEFTNEGFLRAQKHLLKSINRRKVPHVQVQQQNSHAQNLPLPSCIEVGKFGIDEEVERLKRDKNLLMQELVRLRQQQQSTDGQLQTVGQRVHVMEQRQQQMMSFLAKAMQSPGFASPLQNDSPRQISGANKKRRLPNQNEESLACKLSITSSDGPMVKYQPLMNEAAKAMLRQILKMNTSNRPESNGFLIDNADSSSNVVDSSTSSSSRISGVTLSEVQSSSFPTHVNACSTFFPEANTGGVPMDFISGQSISPEKSLDLPKFVDASVQAPLDEPLEDYEVDVLLDDIHKLAGTSNDTNKLPSINDVFWEQFLLQTALTETSDGTNTVNVGYGSSKDQLIELESEWDRLRNMNNLTSQMGLLASSAKSG